MIVEGIDIIVKKSNRKTVSIFVERDGSVSALVPETLTTKHIQEIMISKSYQIHKNLAEWKQLNERNIIREYVSGQSFMYLGRNYRLKVVNEPLGMLVFKKGIFYLGKNEVSKGDIYFKDFYKAKLEKKIVPIIKLYEDRLGVKSNQIKVMELQHRWASCTEKGNLHFHWKCAMAPIDVLNYIVAHELTHLIHMNHSQAFWNELDKVIPNYEKQQLWLKYNGAGMDL
jgi:predicted metal-dependent hydrolase